MARSPSLQRDADGVRPALPASTEIAVHRRRGGTFHARLAMSIAAIVPSDHAFLAQYRCIDTERVHLFPMKEMLPAVDPKAKAAISRDDVIPPAQRSYRFAA
ncbi:hypothetical protein GCM10010203_33910 [Actinomadura yumaensis]